MMSPPSILVVDDDEDLLFVVHLVLKKLGYQVDILSDCTKFFDLLRDKLPPDLIILDINLGPCDERNLCSQVKQVSHLQHIPIVLYSSDRFDNSICGNSQAACFIQKPFTIEHFQGKIGELLRI